MNIDDSSSLVITSYRHGTNSSFEVDFGPCVYIDQVTGCHALYKDLLTIFFIRVARYKKGLKLMDLSCGYDGLLYT